MADMIPYTHTHDWTAGVQGRFGVLPSDGDPIADSPLEQHVESFSMDHMVGDDDITNTGSGGAQDVIRTIESANGTVTFVYDAAADPNVSPQVFKPGSTPWLFFEPDGRQRFYFRALVTKSSWGSGPKVSGGAVRCTCDFKSKGPIVTPTTSQPFPAAST